MHQTLSGGAPVLGRRRRRHPSLDAFADLAAPTEARRRADLPFVPHVTILPRWNNLLPESKFQHLAPTVRATKKPPAMAPKRASSKAAPSIDEAAKVALLAEKKGKAPADTTHQEACEDDALSKRQRNDHVHDYFRQIGRHPQGVAFQGFGTGREIGRAHV